MAFTRFTRFASHARIGVLTLPCLFCVLWFADARGQCTAQCGDANEDGTFNVIDPHMVLVDLFSDQVTPSECAEADGADPVTIRDATWIAWYVFMAGQVPVCPGGDPYVSVRDSAYRMVYTSIFPADTGAYTVCLDFVNSNSILAAVLPFRVRVDGAVPVIRTVQYQPWPGWNFSARDIDSADGAVFMVYGCYCPLALEAGLRPLCQIELELPPAGHPREITIEWRDWGPVMHGRSCNYPTVLDSNWNTWEPVLIPASPGDCNADGVVTSADIIRMVNHVFKGGPAPIPDPCMGDVNCSSEITSADIILLVNYVFKGGVPPRC